MTQIIALAVGGKKSRRLETERTLLVMPLSVARIAQAVAQIHRVHIGVMLSTANVDRATVKARRAALRRIRREVQVRGKPVSYYVIGHWLGMSDTTVMEACGALRPSTERRRQAA